MALLLPIGIFEYYLLLIFISACSVDDYLYRRIWITVGNTPDPPNMADTTDDWTLVQQHGWRLAILAGSMVTALTSLLRDGGGSAELSMKNASLFIVVFLLALLLRREAKTVLQRKHLPAGNYGFPVIGHLVEAIMTPVQHVMKNKKLFGNTFFENTFSHSIVFGDHRDIAWLWDLERRGHAVTAWPAPIRRLVGSDSILIVSGERHRVLRRIFEPAFTPQAVKDYLAAIDKVTRESLGQWSSQDLISTDVFKVFALRLFYYAAFGYVKESVIGPLHDDTKLFLNGFKTPLPIAIPGTTFGKAMAARARCIRLAERLIEQFKEENPVHSERGQRTLMGRLCYGTDENKEALPMDVLAENLLSIIIAGHDTSAASMGTALYYLSEYPQVKKAVAEEVKKFREPLDFDELKNAPGLNSFLTECWRMNPPIVFSFRQSTVSAEHSGYKIPKGMVLSFNMVLANQNETVYPEPSRFAFQRFLPKDHPLVTEQYLRLKTVDELDFGRLAQSYLPTFGGGLHGCLGRHFAKLEMRVLITRLLQSYDFQVRNSSRQEFPVNTWRHDIIVTPT